MNHPSMSRAHLGETPYPMPAIPWQQIILPLYSAEETELTPQMQMQQYLFTQAIASDHVNDIIDLFRKYRDDSLRMPLLQSEHPLTSDSEDAELIQQRQLDHFILSQAIASASNTVNYTNALFSNAFDRQNEGAQYNQLIQKELDRIIHSSTFIPVQNVHQENCHVNNYASADSPSDVRAFAQVGRGTPASMEHPTAAHQRWSATTFPAAGLTSAANFIAMSSRNRAEEAVQFTPPIRNDVGEAKAKADVSDKRTPQSTTAILKALGNRTRTTAVPYIDVSDMAQDPGYRPPIRGGVVNRFPEKLHQMFTAVEAQGRSHIASFYPHGRAFAIHDGARFEAEILPKFLPDQGKLSSFSRQLNLYGFIKIKSGPDSGGYYHELFLKGRPWLTDFMRRVGASKRAPNNGVNKGKQSKKERRSTAQSRRQQPNFHTMKCMLPVQHDAWRQDFPSAKSLSTTERQETFTTREVADARRKLPSAIGI